MGIDWRLKSEVGWPSEMGINRTGNGPIGTYIQTVSSSSKGRVKNDINGTVACSCYAKNSIK